MMRPQMMLPQMMGMQPQMMGMQPQMGMPGMMQPGLQMPSALMSAPPIPSPGAPVDMVRLIAEGGQYNGRVFDLPQLPEISVGRGVDNNLVLDDPSMSRKHTKLRRLGNSRLEVEDLISANGTYINGRKVTTAQLG